MVNKTFFTIFLESKIFFKIFNQNYESILFGPTLADLTLIIFIFQSIECNMLFLVSSMQCRTPPLTNGLINGQRTAAFRVRPGVSVTFTCDSGYYLKGSSSLQCVDRVDANPEWNQPIPECLQGTFFKIL